MQLPGTATVANVTVTVSPTIAIRGLYQEARDLARRHVVLPNIWTEEDYRKYWGYTDKERALYAMWERNAQRDEDLHARLADARAEAKQRNKHTENVHAVRSTD